MFPEDSVELAWEILGDLITAESSIQKAICVVGEGGNGKSTFCQLCTSFIGDRNAVHLSLQSLRATASRRRGSTASLPISAPTCLAHIWKRAPSLKLLRAAIASPVK